MTIVFERFVLFIFAVALVVNFYNDNNAMKRDVEANKHNEEWECGLMFRIANLESKVDSVNAKTIQVAKATMYLDSCQVVKVNKAERAERRGRFVGGLLRGLIPGL